MKNKIIGDLKTSPAIKKHTQNPILSSKDIPYDSLLVFNPGVTKYQGKYVMVFRNDFCSKEKGRISGTILGLAFSDNGINWNVESKPCFEISNDEVKSINDLRLTLIEDKCYITFAMIGRHGVCGGIAITEDFVTFEIIHITMPDNRNLVLFSERIFNNYFRLDRPFANYLREEQDRFDIWISESSDLNFWGNHKLLLKAEDVPFCNDKIGPGPPPIKTKEGWLQIFHSVDVDPNRGKNGWEDKWDKRYCAGIMLLDLDNPTKIIGLYKEPLIAPEEKYETEGGFRNHVIFPTGMILENSDEVKIYYGAADTVVCLATANVYDLINLCQHSEINHIDRK